MTLVYCLKFLNFNIWSVVYIIFKLSDFVSDLQRFIMILTDHLAKCEGNGIDYNTPWYKWVIERLQQIFLLVSIYRLLSLIFTSINRAIEQ